MPYIKYQGDPSYSRLGSGANLCSSTPVKPGLGLENGVFTITGGGTAGGSNAAFSEFKTISYPVDGYSMINLELCQGETVELLNNNLTSLILTGISGTVTNTTTLTIGAQTSIAGKTVTVYKSNGDSLGSGSVNQQGTIITLTSPTTNAALTGLKIVSSLNESKPYIKGILLSVKYPMVDESGAETNPSEFYVDLEYDTLDETYDLGNPCLLPVGQYFVHFAPEASSDSRRLINTLYITNPSTKFSVKVTALLIKTKTDTDPNNCDC